MKIMRWILGLLISLFFSTAVQANVIVATMYTPIGYASYSTKITYYLDVLTPIASITVFMRHQITPV